MKILAINGFNKEKEPALNSILDAFLAGAQKTGALVNKINLKDYDIKPCKGCYEDLDFKSQNDKCYQDDDMNKIYPELNNSDVWVLAFPYTLCGGNSELFNFLDRFEPLLHIDNIPNRKLENGKVLLISSCSFWDEASYIPLLEQFKDFCVMYGMSFAGALVRPDARLFSTLEIDNTELFSVISAAEKAGEFISYNKEIPENIINLISQDLKERKQIYVHN